MSKEKDPIWLKPIALLIMGLVWLWEKMSGNVWREGSMYTKEQWKKIEDDRKKRWGTK